MSSKVMKTQHWIVLLLASSGLTGVLGYHWGQKTGRQSLTQQKTAAQTLLEKQRSDPDFQQWNKIQKDLARWTALCADSHSDQQGKITDCMMRDVAQQAAVELMQDQLHRQLNRPPALTAQPESEDRHR